MDSSPWHPAQINCLQSPEGLNILRPSAKPYEKIPYYIHRNSGHRRLDDFLR